MSLSSNFQNNSPKKLDIYDFGISKNKFECHCYHGDTE